jgi:hypothetical protein
MSLSQLFLIVNIAQQNDQPNLDKLQAKGLHTDQKTTRTLLEYQCVFFNPRGIKFLLFAKNHL